MNEKQTHQGNAPAEGLIEVWFPIEKDANGYPETRSWEGMLSRKSTEGCLPTNHQEPLNRMLCMPWKRRDAMQSKTPSNAERVSLQEIKRDGGVAAISPGVKLASSLE
jgi:hypothetical protein